MSNKKWLLCLFALLTFLVGACSNQGSPIFQLEIPSETTLQVGDSESIAIDIIVAEIFGENEKDISYGLEVTVKPDSGPVVITKIKGSEAGVRSKSLATIGVSGRGDVFTSVEITCIDSGEAEVLVKASGADGSDNASMQVQCVNRGDATSDESSESEDDSITGLPDCEKFDSDINVGSIGQVGEAAAATGLIPEGVSSRDVGLELRLMMETKGEVCQSDLLALVTDGALSPELEDAIITAVERVKESN